MPNWTHRAGRMEVGRGRVVPGPWKADAVGTRDGTRCFIERTRRNLALTPTLSHPKRAGEGEDRDWTREVEVERDWPAGRSGEPRDGTRNEMIQTRPLPRATDSKIGNRP